MDLKLKGLRVLITGSSRGLGYATARALAQEGCRVAINGREQEKLTRAAQKLSSETGAEILPLAGDIGSREVPADLIHGIIDAWDGLDILITNAGGPPTGPFESHSEEAWQKAIELSLLSHVRLIRAALPYLRQSPVANVLTITSISVKQPIANLVLSNSIRAATLGLTKSLALELGTQGIRFNSILPSWTDTERVQELMASRASTNGTSIEEETRKQAEQSPLGRLCTPEEFAASAVFLVSPISSYLTGVMLPVDGGTYKGLY